MHLFTEVSAIANEIYVYSWGHHYRTYNIMAIRLANIAMDTGASFQGHATSNPVLVQETTTFLDSNVKHWLETSQAEKYVIQGPVLTPRNLIIPRQESERRRSDVGELVLPSI